MRNHELPDTSQQGLKKMRPVDPGPLLHEAVMDKFLSDKKGRPVVDPVIDAMKEAVRAMRLGVEDCKTATKTILANEMNTPINNIRAAANVNHKKFLRVAGLIDATNGLTKQEMQRLWESTYAPKNSPYSGEIRAGIKAMTRDERVKTINEALKNNEDEVIAAILHGPLLLTGMQEGEREYFRTYWRAKRFPQEVEREQRLKKATEILERLANYSIAYVEHLTDTSEVNRAEETERAARAAIEAA